MPHTISPGGILRALDYLAENKVEMHSLLVAEKGKLCCEAYWDPWKRDSLHRMYSVTKSFVSIAIGCLEHDGLISIDDRIAAYFPEYASLPPELSSLTIRNMLMMRTCHSATTYKQGCNPRYIPSWKDDWVGSFFCTGPDHDPGSVFIYDTSSSHVLASLVERVTGESFLGYLRRKFLSSLDIAPGTYIMPDPKGSPIGGSGLMMRPLDLMNVLIFFSRGMGGIIGKEYLENAVSPLSVVSDSKFSGYGYFFWTLDGGSYAMYGMGGQYAFYNPESNVAIVTTAATQGTKGGEEAILYAVRKISEGVWNDKDAEDDELSLHLHTLKIDTVEGSWDCCPSKRTYSFCGQHGLEEMTFDFGADGGVVEAVYYGIRYVLPFGYGRNVISDFPARRSSPVASSGAFLQDGSFMLVSHLMNEEIGTIRITASFSGNRVTVLPSLSGEFSFRGFEGVATGILVQ